ncbi:hypothetical protein DSM106972_031430 [Dulcicalothrix desertica PCC 7102]|uniref:Uncharacterized protein n=1 Tax=Dulcicalothrix desertica PCC 7102 TaxID=232991 RepID=A0A3S1APE8_9CYAN|nr:hypothetical protein [Dulcicalothrix desertica]RUT05937.1 hypothetical protein DSM106972_031430 [Dulcicalothrix desertica PCC 7102]
MSQVSERLSRLAVFNLYNVSQLKITNSSLCQKFTDIKFIHANGLDLGDNRQKQGINEAQAEIEQLIATW